MKIKDKNKKDIRYCSYCGHKIEPELVGAEVKVLMCYGMDCFKQPVGNRFDEKTGKRQYVRRYRCPNWRKRFLFSSPHDSYIVKEIIIL